ncbi:DUF4279 domain-containing protein [Sphingobacterium sp. SG20118]|uniref:DUF4279 domain-containing protein n=1 Tax=Sphingobacterium sp. SG20118 TaxID=3367156 RepID=UPI0037DFC481
MNENYFLYKTHCEIIILPKVASPSSITEELGVAPSRFFKKGDQSISKKSGSVITKPYDLWAFGLNSTCLKVETISHHIHHLKTTFSLKIDILRKYKESSDYDVSFWVWIESDNVGIGLDLDSEELDFINSITNKMHISFIANKDFDKDVVRFDT